MISDCCFQGAPATFCVRPLRHILRPPLVLIYGASDSPAIVRKARIFRWLVGRAQSIRFRVAEPEYKTRSDELKA